MGISAIMLGTILCAIGTLVQFTLCSQVSGNVSSECIVSAYMRRDTQFDGFMSMSNVSKIYSARSQIDCLRHCTDRYRCKSSLFNPEANQCQISTNRLTSTAGLKWSPGAIYHYKYKYGHGQFRCPKFDGDYHTISFYGSCTQIRAVHDNRNYTDANADCEATGGRLMAIHNAERKALFDDFLSNCPGFGINYIVGGTNANAVNPTAVDAYTTNYGEVITVGDPLWDIGRYSLYNPTTDHCLTYHYGHHDTRSCSTYRTRYMCEKPID